MRKRIIAFVLFLVLLFFFLSRIVDLEKVFSLLFTFPKERIVLLCFLSLFISLLKSWRFFLLLKNNGVQVSFIKTCKVYFAGQLTTPFPGGEAFRAVLLKQEIGSNIDEVSGAVVTQAFLEFFSAAILAIIGSFVYKTLRGLSIIALLILIGIIFLLLSKSALLLLLGKLSRFSQVKTMEKGLLQTQNDIRKNILGKKNLSLNMVFIKTLIIAFVAHVLGGLIIFLIVQAFTMHVNFYKSTFIYTASIVLTALAGLIPGGLGVTEGGLTGILLLSRVTLAKALVIVLLFRIITLLFYMLVGFTAFMLFYFKGFVLRKS